MNLHRFDKHKKKKLAPSHPAGIEPLKSQFLLLDVFQFTKPQTKQTSPRHHHDLPFLGFFSLAVLSSCPLLSFFVYPGVMKVPFLFFCFLIGAAVAFPSIFSSVGNHHPISFRHEDSFDEVIEFWTAERRAKAIPFVPQLQRGEVGEDTEDVSCHREYDDLTNKTFYSDYPLSAVGVLFFSLNKTLYQCSASIGYGKYIWTAGHCLYDRDTMDYAKKANFIPGYFNGNIPFKQFPLHYTYIPTGWKALDGDQSLSYDYAMAALHDNAETEVGGRFDLVVNLVPTEVEYWSLGYPVETNGKEYIHSCVSGSCGRDETTFPSPLPVEIRCNSKGGSSGGPWLIQIPSDPLNYYLNGLNSYSYALQRNAMYGPYFNDDTNFFYLSVTNGTTPDDHRQKKFMGSAWFYICVSLAAIILSLVIVGILKAVTPRKDGFNYTNLA